MSTKTNVKPVPEGSHTITPHLVCAGAADAIEFYKKAFGAVELYRIPGPDGKLMNATVKIGNSNVMLVDEMLDWGCKGPKSLQGSPVTLHIYTEDVDALFDRAVKAGAKVAMPLDNMFWGDRYGRVEDPFGHQWSLATHLKDMSPDEMKEAAAKACCPDGKK